MRPNVQVSFWGLLVWMGGGLAFYFLGQSIGHDAGGAVPEAGLPFTAPGAERMAVIASPHPAVRFEDFHLSLHSSVGLAEVLQVIAGLSREETERLIREGMQFLRSPAKDRVLVLLWKRLAEFGPLNAIEDARAVENPPMRRLAMDAVLSVWQKADPTGAWIWLGQNVDDLDRRRHVPEIVEEIALQRGTEAAMHFVRSLWDRYDKAAAMTALGARISNFDSQQFSELLGNAENESSRLRLTGQGIMALGEEDPAAALNLLFSLEERDGIHGAFSRGGSVLSTIISRWLEGGGLVDAWAWAEGHPDPWESDLARQSILERLAHYDLRSAFSLVREVETESVRDEVLDRLVYRGRLNPAALRSEVERLPPGSWRDQVAAAVAVAISRWMGSDAAKEFVLSTPALTGAQREMLLERIEPRH